MELLTSIFLGVAAILMGAALIFYGLKRRENRARPSSDIRNRQNLQNRNRGGL